MATSLNMTGTIVKEGAGRTAATMVLQRLVATLTSFDHHEEALVGGSLANVIALAAAEVNFLLVRTPKAVDLNITTPGGAVAVQCGSYFLAFDTKITALTIDNDVLAVDASVTVEVWSGTHALTT